MNTKGSSYPRLLLPFSAAVLALTCTTAVVSLSRLSSEQRQRIETRRFGFSDSTLFSAVLASLVETGYSFGVTDRALGLVQTEPLMYPEVASRSAIAEAFSGVNYLWRRRATVRVASGKVSINYVFESKYKGTLKDEYGWEMQELDTGLTNPVYRSAFRNIGKYLYK